MANFPHWINKKSTTATTLTSSLSPRQVANKAYSLAIKKLDRDDKRRRPHYTVRERLLLSNTMTKAEDLLNKRTPRSNRRVLASEFDDDVSICPPATNIPPPAPFQMQPLQEKPVVAAPAPAPVQVQVQVQAQVQAQVQSQIQAQTPPTTQAFQYLESTTTATANLPTAEQIAVSLAVVAAVAYNSLVATVTENQQKASFCRPMMIPSHSITSFKTII
ncbi:hypothetical protein INT46_010769 [Mucor plumbeus]|uniref:Uncharacterized protein n=1 Tax=Mucor plumbeus TaxID=97098 RepID=A0A8H7R717_9FUNG|nr:hypothetical protein INT46_010769 [Mucor plumbeus]